MKKTVFIVTEQASLVDFIRKMNEENQFGFFIESCTCSMYWENENRIAASGAILFLDLDGFDALSQQKIKNRLNPHQNHPSTIVIKKQFSHDETRTFFKQGVLDCLSKPLHAETVFQILNEPDARAGKPLHDPEEGEDRWKAVIPSLKIGLAYDLIFGNIKNSKEIWDKCKLTGLSAVPNTTLVVQIDDFIALTRNKSKLWEHAIRHEITVAIQTFLATKTKEMLVISTASDKIAVLLPIPLQNSKTEYKQIVKMYVEELKNYVKEHTGNTVTIGIGHTYEDPRNLHISYQEALYVQKYKFFSGKDTYIHIDDVEPFSNEVALLPNDDVLSLASKLSVGDLVSVKLSIEKLLGNLFAQQNTDPDSLKLQILELLTTLAHSAISGGADHKDVFTMHHKYATELNVVESIAEMKEWLERVVDQFLEMVLVNNNEHTLKSIRKACQYIDQHFHENITLEQVASHVHLSTNYFSSIFKNTTGTSFVEYITNLRIEKAKAMLMDLNHTVYHIAYQVGYNDPRYFSRVFKTAVGKTPSKYRNSVLGPNAATRERASN